MPDPPFDAPASLLDDAPIGVAYGTAGGIVTGANERFAALLGLSRAEIIGRAFSDFTHDEDLAGDREAIRALIAGERRADSREKRYRRADGSLVWARRKLAWTGSELIALTEDITREVRQRELQAASVHASAVLAGLRDEQAILAALPGILVPALGDLCTVVVVDAEGHVTYSASRGIDDPADRVLAEVRQAQPHHPVSAPAARALATREQVHIADLAAWATTRPADDIYAQAVRSAGVRSGTMTPLIVHGQPIGVMSVGVLQRTGRRHDADDFAALGDLASRVALALANARLFTAAESARLQAEEHARELRQLVERLAHEKEVSEGLLAVLRERDRKKDEFLAMLAHELRNPLAPILNAVQLMQRKGVEGSEQAIIERQTRHLTRLVDDLLDVSRITRGAVLLKREPTELAAALERAVELARAGADEGGHTVEVRLPDRPLPLRADPVRLTQIFGNLLSNAIRYSPPGAVVHLEAEEVDGHAVVRVRDHGIGLAPADLGRIFDLFVQVDPGKDRRTGGLGIGLTVVKRLVEMHGGLIEARSAGLGQGSELVVRLPLTDAQSPDAAPAPPPRLRLDGKRVLVVDDNVDAASMLAEVMELLGGTVDIAHDGESALAAARRARPDVALLDIGLPGLDGLAVARELDGLPGGKPLLVAISGYGQDGDRNDSQAAGFDAHYVKPLDLAALEAFLASRLQ